MKKLRITVNGTSYEVDVEVLEDDESSLPSYGYAASSAPQVTPRAPSSNNAPNPQAAPPAAPSSAADGNVLTSPIAGIIVEIKVRPGSDVKENDPVIVIEAMKMNTNISSPVSGKVKTVEIAAGDSVKQGQVLLTFE